MIEAQAITRTKGLVYPITLRQAQRDKERMLALSSPD